MLARAGHKVTLIGRPAHVEATQRDGLKLDLASAPATEIVRLGASSDLSCLQSADLVLFCVKSTDSASVARQMAPNLAPHALIMSLQNGVENSALIAQQVPHAVIPCVVYVATEIPAPGCVKHHGRGDLVIGTMQTSRLSEPQKTLQEIVELFGSAQVPVQISQNVMVELWSKLLINCAFNAISGLAQIQYEKLAALESVRSTQTALVKEVIAVALADGIHLSEPVALEAVAKISVTMGGQKSSTAQDMARSKPSEIDHLNGFIVRRGQALGVATPVNQALFALVKLVESTYTDHV
jgi:2-dehydropantoate 2-reductase